MMTFTAQYQRADSRLPSWIIWIQCVAFVVLYAVWILPEIVGFRNTALVIGAVLGAHSIYQYRDVFLQNSALSIWLIIALFAWATLHLFFLSPNFPLQYIENYRIWKYAAIGSVMAIGLGVSLVNSKAQESNYYWYVIYFGLCTLVIIYLIKYVLTTYFLEFGIHVPMSLRIYISPQPFYVPKTDYVAFCLPAFSVALGVLDNLSMITTRWHAKEYVNLIIKTGVIAATLFLFVAQNIKNGIAYAAILFFIFGIFLFIGKNSKFDWKKILAVLVIFSVMAVAVSINIQKIILG